MQENLENQAVEEYSANEIIGKNLVELRKSKKLTQLELAETLNYSDKAVSKWENGDAVPSIDILLKITSFYGVTLNDLVDPNFRVKNEKEIRKKQSASKNRLIITLLSTMLVFMVATLLFVSLIIAYNKIFWMCFVWAIPVASIVVLVFNSIWGKTRYNLIIITILIWSILASIYLQCLQYNLYPLFFLGIPAQCLVLLWFCLTFGAPEQVNDKKENIKSENTEEQTTTEK